MKNETKIVRLTSHEEIIGNVTSTDAGVKIKDPLIIIPTSQKALALAPWMPYTTIADDGIEIDSDRIMFIVTPHAELAKEHMSAISGLIVPGAQSARDPMVAGVIGAGMLKED
jgi:hypothetical protein